MSSPIRKVIVVGASGAVGRPVVTALLEEDFQVTALTRDSSNATFPDGVKVAKTDYSRGSLDQAFQGQDAVVSTVAGSGISSQITLIDAAVAAGVKVFIPSEYGIDTQSTNAPEVIPLTAHKIAALNHLRSFKDKISWTVLVTGALFDWNFDFPGFGGWNLQARTAVIWDGGDVPFEGTNLPQTGKAVAAILKNPELTKDQYVYINSFTTTQNEVLKELEIATGDKFKVETASTEETWRNGLEKVAKGGEGLMEGVIAIIHAGYYGKGDLNNYSKKGLWNDKLALPKETLAGTIKEIVASHK